MPLQEKDAFELTVSVKDVDIGGGIVAEDTLKANLKKIFGLEGAETLEQAMFSSDGIEIIFDKPIDGKARFTATLSVGAGNAYFMRVKMK